jgi:hypothetical protein
MTTDKRVQTLKRIYVNKIMYHVTASELGV